MTSLRVLGAAAVAALALLAGCSAAGSSSLPASGGAAVPEPADAGGGDGVPGYTGQDKSPDGSPAEVPGTIGSQKIARTARVALTVTDVDAAAARLRDIAATMNGQVTAENLVVRTDAEGNRQPTSTMVISVPADRLDATLEQLAAVGDVTSRVISSEDVTTQVADIGARINTLNASIARLQDLSKRAGTVSQLVELENELTNRIAERDSLVAQQKVLATRVALSPVTITLTTPEQVAPIETPGFLGGLLAGWNALVSSSRVLMTVVGAVLPFAAVAALIGLPLLAWRRRTRRTRTTPPQTSARAQQAGGTGSANTE